MLSACPRRCDKARIGPRAQRSPGSHNHAVGARMRLERHGRPPRSGHPVRGAVLNQAIGPNQQPIHAAATVEATKPRSFVFFVPFVAQTSCSSCPSWLRASSSWWLGTQLAMRRARRCTMRRVLLAIAVVTWVTAGLAAQSKFSIDGSNIRLETAPPKGASQEGRAGKKPDSLKGFFKDFKAGACRAQASPMVPSSSWPARGDAAITVCRP